MFASTCNHGVETGKVEASALRPLFRNTSLFPGNADHADLHVRREGEVQHGETVIRGGIFIRFNTPFKELHSFVYGKD